jgi:ankyrin repeat protein
MIDATLIHEAYRRGDLEALKRLLGDAPDFPNCRGPAGAGEIPLEYAIYHSPFSFVRTLLELGADPNYGNHAGFPSLIAALSTERADRYELIEVLLTFGADLGQRGLNDWTPLHYAAANDDLEGIKLLLSRGADATARTRIDDFSTPLEEAERLRRTDAAWLLRHVTDKR